MTGLSRMHCPTAVENRVLRSLCAPHTTYRSRRIGAVGTARSARGFARSGRRRYPLVHLPTATASSTYGQQMAVPYRSTLRGRNSFRCRLAGMRAKSRDALSMSS